MCLWKTSTISLFYAITSISLGPPALKQSDYSVTQPMLKLHWWLRTFTTNVYVLTERYSTWFMHCQYITEVWRRSGAGDLTLAIEQNHGHYSEITTNNYYRDSFIIAATLFYRSIKSCRLNKRGQKDYLKCIWSGISFSIF